MKNSVFLKYSSIYASMKDFLILTLLLGDGK